MKKEQINSRNEINGDIEEILLETLIQCAPECYKAANQYALEKGFENTPDFVIDAIKCGDFCMAATSGLNGNKNNNRSLIIICQEMCRKTKERFTRENSAKYKDLIEKCFRSEEACSIYLN